jgi:hypothetical protein
MDFSSVFKKDIAGKYASVLPGFSPGISLGENLTTMERPLNQRAGGVGAPSGSTFEDALTQIITRESDPAYMEQRMKAKLAYDKEQMKQAFPYLMAREIPRQISEGFAQNAALTVLGARNATEAMNQTLAAYPKLSFASVPYQGPQKYFS